MSKHSYRVLVCGSREWSDYGTVFHTLSATHQGKHGPVTTVVHGACRGADQIGGAVARSLGIEVEPFPADWRKEGLAAGPKRNQRMLDSGIDYALVFHNDLDHSKGTKDMVNRLKKAKVPFLHITTRKAP